MIAADEGAVGDANAVQDAGSTAGGWVRKVTAHREGDGIGVGRLEPAGGGGIDEAEAKGAGGRTVTAAAC